MPHGFPDTGTTEGVILASRLSRVIRFFLKQGFLLLGIPYQNFRRADVIFMTTFLSHDDERLNKA
jgi:hypothetical protein